MTWHGERWEGHRFRAWLIRAVVFIVPVVAAIVVATVVANSLPVPDGLWGSLAWWALVLGSSLGTMSLVVAGPNADDDMRLGLDVAGFESSFVLRAG